MKITTVLKLVVLMLSLTSCDISALPPNQSQTQSGKLLGETALSIDKKCRDELGVGIMALGLLFEAKPGTFFLEESLRTEERWNAITELEKKEFIQLRKIKSVQGELLELTPTEKGSEIANALKQKK